jgi:hypothetical protein
VKEQKEIDPDWHLLVTRQDVGCLRIIHYDCNCNSGYRCDCKSKRNLPMEYRTLKNESEIAKSIQDTINTVDTNISFDENIGTIMKLYFFIKG